MGVGGDSFGLGSVANFGTDSLTGTSAAKAGLKLRAYVVAALHFVQGKKSRPTRILEDERLGVSGALALASHGEGAFDDALGFGGEIKTVEFVFG